MAVDAAGGFAGGGAVAVTEAELPALMIAAAGGTALRCGFGGVTGVVGAAGDGLPRPGEQHQRRVVCVRSAAAGRTTSTAAIRAVPWDHAAARGAIPGARWRRQRPPRDRGTSHTAPQHDEVDAASRAVD